MPERTIEIPAIDRRQMLVTITGDTPLITHRFGERARKQIEDKQQKVAKNAKEARDPQAEFEDSLYPLPKGAFGFPAAGIKKALVTAGGRFADEKMTHLRGAINIIGDILTIDGSKPEMRRDTVRLSSGVASISYRPMFRDWSITARVSYNATIISQEQVLNLFNLAGFSVGIGDWRPEKNGTFGQFQIQTVTSD